MSAYDSLVHISVDVDDGVAWAVIDHPPINLWDRELTNDLVGLVGAFQADDAARVLVLTSANPDFFIAHADVGMILEMDASAQGNEGEPAPVNLLLESLRESPKVSIALVQGIARGGGSEIALACDMRFASDDAIFAQPEVALGIIPGAGGTQRLSRLVGRPRALEIVLGCSDVDAEEAEAIGYINNVLDDDAIEEFVLDLATRIASMPRVAVAEAKRAIDAAFGDQAVGFATEASAFRTALAEPVARQRMARFLELGGQTADVEEGDLTDLLDQLDESEHDESGLDESR
jgi:enoyl-CoA hydratase/carnithine racemase